MSSNADQFVGFLTLRLGQLDEAERHFETGLEWCEQERCPIEAGRNHQGLAEVAVHRGEDAEAIHHLDAAAALFEQHGAKRYLAHARARREELRPRSRGRRASYPAGLTAREVDVLRLVAAGKSNPQIAEALVISPRTVARHVSNSLDKTGLSNRTELATYALIQGLVAP